MHKVSRSLLFASIVAFGGLAACGDDITIPPQPPTVALAPDPVQVAVGATATINAAVNNAQGTATRNWTSGNTAVATVDQNGVVTGVANGSTTVTLTVTGSNGTAQDVVTVNVGTGGGTGGTPSITIQGVNVTVCGVAGCNSVPATLNAITGQIDVTLNLETAGVPVSRVELVVRDVASGAETVCGTQNITSAAVEASDAEAAAAQVPITISCNTARTTAAGLAEFLNGQKEIRARLIGPNNTVIQSVANTFQVTFANQSQFVVSYVNNPTTPEALRPATGDAVSTNDGLLYEQGGLTITLQGVNYTAGATNTFETVAAQLVQDDPALPGTDVINVTFTKAATANAFTATVSGTNAAALGGAMGLYTIDVTGSTTAGGSVGPTTESGATEVRIDNVQPVSTGAFAAALATNFFVNGTYSFASNNAALFVAPTAPADAGVGGTQVKFYVAPKAVVDTLNVAALNNAEITGFTAVTTAENLAATLQNNVYGLIAITHDALGNYVGQKLAVNFGVDKAAPTGLGFTTIFGNNAINPTTVLDPNETTFADDASGFGLAPLRVRVTRTNAAATDACVTTPALARVVNSVCLPIDTTNAFTLDPATLTTAGYYNVTLALRDTAGNVTADSTRSFLIDAAAPTFTGGLTIPGLITPGPTATFTASVPDTLDLDVAYLVVGFGSGARVRVDSADIGAYGVPLERTATPTFNVAAFPRSFQLTTAANAPQAGAGSEANLVDVRAYDQGGNSAVLSQPIPAQNLGGTTVDWTTLGISTFAITSPADGANIENDATITANGDPETRDLVAEVLATGLDINNPFDQVVFWYQDASGEFVRIGSAVATVTTNAANQRIFRYTLTSWNPPASLGTGTPVEVIATGFRGANILGTQTITINLTTT